MRLASTLLFLLATVAAEHCEKILMTEDVIHELELSSLYADCGVYDDPVLFGGHVCGCDGITYPNCLHLSCINHWRQPHEKVQILHKGPCKTCVPTYPWSPVYNPICGTNNQTFANLEAMLLHNDLTGEGVQIFHEGVCGGACFDLPFWEGAVCASNGRTYPSVNAIADLRRFGQCHDVIHDGGCTVEEVRQRLRGRAEVCSLARDCYEYNPVCGDDGVTYPNPYLMICYKPTVRGLYSGTCENHIYRSCQASLRVDKGELPSPGPVCASDGLAYPSVYHLQCAKDTDKHLYMLHPGKCTAADSPCACMPEVDDGGEPVCASDGVTYVNPHALWCMQRTEDPMLRYSHDGQCFKRCVECTCGCEG